MVYLKKRNRNMLFSPRIHALKLLEKMTCTSILCIPTFLGRGPGRQYNIEPHTLSSADSNHAPS